MSRKLLSLDLFKLVSRNFPDESLPSFQISAMAAFVSCWMLVFCQVSSQFTCRVRQSTTKWNLRRGRSVSLSWVKSDSSSSLLSCPTARGKTRDSLVCVWYGGRETRSLSALQVNMALRSSKFKSFNSFGQIVVTGVRMEAETCHIKLCGLATCDVLIVKAAVLFLPLSSVYKI